MGTIEDLIFRMPLGHSQFSTLFLNVAQSSTDSFHVFMLYVGVSGALLDRGHKCITAISKEVDV
jgi:hypothetical protein